MKWMTLLFSGYLLLLTFIPCGDVKDSHYGTEGHLMAVSHEAGEQHEHSSETCSPFCACACCGTISFFQPLVQVKIPKPIHIAPQFLVYICANPQSVSNAIWQPPRDC